MLDSVSRVQDSNLLPLGRIKLPEPQQATALVPPLASLAYSLGIDSQSVTPSQKWSSATCSRTPDQH